MTSSLTPRAPRVLCYSPYNRWALHGQWEMTVLHALRNRGAEVHYVLCDGLYSDCDVFWEATEPRPRNACVQCQLEVTNLVWRLGMDFLWLGRYLTPEEPREARRWVQSLATDELVGARYGDWDIADWITSSVHSHLRLSALEIDDPRVERTFRSYLYSGLVAAFALDRLLADQQPDVLFMFNGRQSSTRVAFALARRRGIRVICHERGPRTETLGLTEDVYCAAVEPQHEYFRQWGETPLTDGEIKAVVTHLYEREHGVGLGWRAFTAAPQPAAAVCARLGLAEDRPTWVLYTSSDDELASEKDWQGAFATQLEWIEQTVEYARRRPDIQLVIRVHPNTGSRVSTGANRRQLEEFERLERALPANVVLVGATEEVSSYTLMDIATATLAFHSTVALEAACKGKPTIVAARSLVAGTPFVRTVADADAYDAMLDELAGVPIGAVFPEVARLAHRFSYGYFFRMPVSFPLVHMPDPSRGELRWGDPAELVPGLDAGLDRCARILLDGEPICPPPGPDECARDDAAEREWFGLPSPASAFRALAFADELIGDASLLRSWAAAFPSGTDATLVIHTPVDATERLIEAVGRAGLDAADGPDLVAVGGEPDALADVDALFTRRAPTGALAAVPRFDDASTAELRSYAETVDPD